MYTAVCDIVLYLSDVKLLGKCLVGITPLLLCSVPPQGVQHFGLRVHTPHVDKHHVVMCLHHLSLSIPSGLWHNGRMLFPSGWLGSAEAQGLKYRQGVHKPDCSHHCQFTDSTTYRVNSIPGSQVWI